MGELTAAGLALGVALALGASAASSASLLRPPPRGYAVTVDPADYLTTTPDASVLAERLAAKFAANGVNTIYLSAYNVEYGAEYKTTYLYNRESEYGRQDLLGKLVTAAHARGIKVIAAFYDHQHRGAWEARPDWREKTASGGDYNPPATDIQYYLSPGNPQAATWWRGLLLDLLHRYPDVDGVELREPIVNWWGTSADYNASVTRAFWAAHPSAALGDETWRRFRQAVLTRFLKAEIALVHRAGRVVHVTTVADAYGAGQLLSADSEARETGFDLGALLNGPVRPDAVKVELIWQQWARLYGRIAFTPAWTRVAALAFAREVRGRAPIVVHVELTDFGRSTMSVEEFRRTLLAADVPQVVGIDFYSDHLADEKGAWPTVRAVYARARPSGRAPAIPHDRGVLVLYDEGSGAARGRLELAKLERTELLNLLSHFNVKWETYPIEKYRRGGLAGHRAVFYEGSVYGNAPQAFLSDVSVFGGAVVWIGQNLFQLERSGVRLPFAQRSQRVVTSYRTIRYRGSTLPAKGEVIPTQAGPGATVVAALGAAGRGTPFVVRAGRFWYVAGSPFSFLNVGSALNGRYLAFADLLHDMLGLPHANAGRQAFLRIEDVNPLTGAAAVRAVTGVLFRRHVPFLISLTPFFVDPTRKLFVSLSQRPALVAALRSAVARGGAIVLHGSTHQYRGVTGLDAEFWDVRSDSGVREDGDAYVRGRLDRALEELWRDGLHPLAWETPHYLATPFDYAVFGDYFSTFVERRTYGVWHGASYQQALPYVVESDVYGGRVVPENLGYVIAGRSDADALVANARRLRVVRDATAGGFVHVGTDTRIVSDLVTRLRALGYRFSDLYMQANAVETSHHVEITGSGIASLPVPSGWFLQERILDRSGSVVRSTLERFSSYARPTRTFAGAPRGGLLSLRLLTPQEAAALRQRGGEPSASAAARTARSTGERLVYAILIVAVGGIALLLASYVGVRAMRARRARP